MLPIYCFVALALSLLLTPLVRDIFLKLGLVDRPDSVRKLNHRIVPRVGGIAIIVAYVVSLSAALLLPPPWGYHMERQFPDVWKLLLATGLIFLTGMLDDLRTLKPWQKLFEQVVAALMAYFGGVQIHLLGNHPLDPWISLPVTVIWLVGCTNAFNLIDGLDGLAAGVGLFATLTMVLAALIGENRDLAMVTLPLVGALLGFLRYNFNPASVFLGDCGSLTIGFLLGCYGAIWGHKSATLLGLTAPIMAMAIPLLDVGLTIFRRFLRNKPIFSPDRGHIHHRLLDRGLHPRTAALVIYGLCGVAAALSLLQNSLYLHFGGPILVIFAIGVWLGVQNLGYSEFSMAQRMLANFRHIVGSNTLLQTFEENLTKATDLATAQKVILDSYQEFGFRSVRMQLDGVVVEESDGDCGDLQLIEPLWQIRIPLPEGQYVNLRHAFAEDWTTHLAVSGYVMIVQRELRSRLALLPLLRKPPTSTAVVEIQPPRRQPSSATHG